MGAARVILRDVAAGDLDVFFAHQREPAGVHMAAFTTPNPDNRREFDALWVKLQKDPAIRMKTILVQGQVAGHILSHRWHGPVEISYWLGQAFWGQGIATAALKLFLEVEKTRPLYARAAHDNHGSLRVLEKCGFVESGRDEGYAAGRKAITAEIILRLD